MGKWVKPFAFKTSLMSSKNWYFFSDIPSFLTHSTIVSIVAAQQPTERLLPCRIGEYNKAHSALNTVAYPCRDSIRNGLVSFRFLALKLSLLVGVMELYYIVVKMTTIWAKKSANELARFFKSSEIFFSSSFLILISSNISIASFLSLRFCHSPFNIILLMDKKDRFERFLSSVMLPLSFFRSAYISLSDIVSIFVSYNLSANAM